MPIKQDKTQIGIRLHADLVRQIDANRQNRTRAEYCRQLIEASLAGIGGDQQAVLDLLGEMIGAVQQELGQIRESAMIAERDSERAVTEIQRLRADFATALVGVLTKIGQAVREEDQRKFAREKAESFVSRVLLYDHSDQQAQT